MANKELIEKIRSEIMAGIKMAKCKKCGCMKDVLEKLFEFLSLNKNKELSQLLVDVRTWLEEMDSIKYSCLGCKHCFPVEAINILTLHFPTLNSSFGTCRFEVKEDRWPPVAGEYFVLCKGKTCPVAVSTLGSIELAETLSNKRPEGLCIVGKTETENIGIEKIIKNTITNPFIRFFIITGKESQGHYSGKTLLSLYENGVDKNMKVIGSPGRHPILKNVSFSEIETFRKQVQIINMTECEDVTKIIITINQFSREIISNYNSKDCCEAVSFIHTSSPSKILASESKKIKMDKAGYFIVIPCSERKIIIVEHYAYDNKLLHIIEGKDARSIYHTIIENGWVTELSHAAYLGRELTRAEFSMKYGIKYIQDKA
ncbi:MAG: DUF4346 domain-containing protein [Planctomycetota bacterium]